MTPLQSWTSTVAFWSTVAQAPSRVARAQTTATLRMMRAASPWRSARREMPVEPPAAEAIPAPVPVIVEAVSVEAPGPVAVEAAPAEPAEPTVVEAAPAEVVPHEALAHASPAAIAAATAALAEALPTEEPAPVPVVAEVPETALAVLAERDGPAPSLPHLDLSLGSILVEVPEPALAEAAAAALQPARSRKPSGGARTRRPGRA